jgi:hypothetical protein
MAGSGKGVLRIAIEDFFETTIVGKWLHSWYTQFADRLEHTFGQEYAELFDKLKDLPIVGKWFDRARYGEIPEGHEAALSSLLGLGLGLGSQAASGLMTPLMRLLNYWIDSQVFSQRLDPQYILELKRRYPDKVGNIWHDFHDLGYADDHINALELIAEKQLSVNEDIAAWLRGLITDQELEDRLYKLWYNIKDRDIIKKLSQVIPGIQDLIRLAVREAWNDETSRRFEYDADYPQQVEEWAKKQGLSPDWVRRYWRAHWELPSVSDGYEMLHRLRPGRTNVPFTKDDLELLLRTADIPRFFRERLIAISYQPYTRVDVRRMYKIGILNKDEVYQTYLDLGYDAEHAKNLTEFTVKYETGDTDTKQEKYRELSLGVLKDGYLKGVIPENELVKRVSNLGYDADETRMIVDLYRLEKSVSDKPAIKSELKTKIRSIVEAGYTLGLIDRDKATQYLSSVGWLDADISSYLDLLDYTLTLQDTSNKVESIHKLYLSRLITEQEVYAELGKLAIPDTYQRRLISNWKLELTTKQRMLTESQYRAAMLKGIITVDDYRMALSGLGYGDYEIDLLVKLYTPAGGTK